MTLYGDGRRTTALAAATEAGFGSYAQFYRVLRAETGRTPTTLRRAGSDPARRVHGGSRPEAVPLVEAIRGGAYARFAQSRHD
jgi:AraC-like DNA-binding protein